MLVFHTFLLLVQETEMNKKLCEENVAVRAEKLVRNEQTGRRSFVTTPLNLIISYFPF